MSEIERMSDEIKQLKTQLINERKEKECLIRGMDEDSEAHKADISKIYDEMNTMKIDYECQINKLHDEIDFEREQAAIYKRYIEKLEKALEDDILYKSAKKAFTYEMNKLYKLPF